MAFNKNDLVEKYRSFMARRNGPDTMARDCFVIALVLLVLSMLFGGSFGSFFSTVGLAALIYAYFRMFSTKMGDRSRENYAYLQKRDPFVAKLKKPFAGVTKAGKDAAAQAAREGQKRAERAQDKEHKYLACPKCKQDIRVPKGAGKIRITCPKCGEKFEKKV